MVKSNQVSEIIGKPMSQAALLLQIIKTEEMVTENTVFDFEPLEKYSTGENFRSLLKQLVFIAYKNQAMTFRGVLHFIKKMNETFPDLKINKEWINIYLRA